ncbi:hypothetical protein EPI10_031808 [Gossypium australe]|uniref:Uncharacterized protein n=1 Tax=Gossypium australe TaxID=47621 RepID=A0A5B6X2M0_9ROSI|nr:hypothetical protein EPI10_031808 [Gossypium australe]
MKRIRFLKEFQVITSNGQPIDQPQEEEWQEFMKLSIKPRIYLLCRKPTSKGTIQVHSQIIIILHGEIIPISPRVIKGLVQPTESSSSLENLLKVYIAKNDAILRNLENLMG